jgi:hypothetical protein
VTVPYEGGGTRYGHLSLIPEAVYVTYDRPPSLLLGRVRIVRRNVRGNRSPALSPFGPFIGHLACLLTRYPCHTVTLMGLLLSLSLSSLAWSLAHQLKIFSSPATFDSLFKRSMYFSNCDLHSQILAKHPHTFVDIFVIFLIPNVATRIFLRDEFCLAAIEMRNI